MARRPFLYIFPAIAFISALILGPSIAAVYVSFTASSSFLDYSFEGPRWYEYLAVNPRFHGNILVSLYFSAVSVAVSYFAGLGLALAYQKFTRLDRMVRTSMLLIWVMMPASAALMWKFILDPNSGMINTILYYLGQPKVNIFANEFLALNAVSLILIWRYTPVAMIFLWAGLQSIGSEINESAALDGAVGLPKLRYITLPLLKPATLAVLLLLLVGGAFAIDFPFILTGGGPFYSTENLALRIYKEGMLSGSFALASAVGVIGLAMSLIILSPVFRNLIRVGQR